MKKTMIGLFALLLGLAWAHESDPAGAIHHHGKLVVVCTEEHFAAIARIIGGEKVDTRFIIKGYRNPFGVESNVGMVAVMNGADVFVVNGQDLEYGWLGEAQARSRNPNVLPGSAGYVDGSEGVTLLPYAFEEIRDSAYFFINLVVGGKHAVGNHHYYLDPANGAVIASNIAAKLEELDKANASYYETNLAAFEKKLGEKTKEWDFRMLPYQGTPVAMVHRSWIYLAERHHLPVVGYLEPREATPYSPDHTKDLIRQMKARDCHIFLEESYFHSPETEQVAREARALLVTLPGSVSQELGVNDYFQFFDQVYDRLVAALKQVKEEAGSR